MAKYGTVCCEKVSFIVIIFVIKRVFYRDNIGYEKRTFIVTIFVICVKGAYYLWVKGSYCDMGMDVTIDCAVRVSQC